MKIIRINKDGTMNELNIKIPKNPINVLNKNKTSCGSDDLKLLYTWKYNNNTIHCYGWYNGEAGFENNHELPPNGVSPFLEEDSSSILLFGDIFLLNYSDNKCVDFNVPDYSLFYDDINEGFDDCDSEEDNSAEEDSYSEDEDYEPLNYTDESDDEMLVSDEEFLDEDTNIY